MILHNTTANSHFVGRANAVFVFGQDDNAPSVISTVVATVRDQINSDRIQLRGAPVFDEKATDHIINTVLPVVDGVVKRLGLAERCFELSIVNLEATSVLEIAFTISGFSADLPIFLAMLSTILQIPIPSNIVSTGHIASPDGDIRMVKGIPTKLTSAINAENIHTFIHPSIDQDNSLGSFSPLKKEIISDAITKAKSHIETIAVSDINELVRAVFTEESVVIASLRQIFYHHSSQKDLTDTPNEKAAVFFGEGIYQRFWKVLERQMLSGESNEAKELISALTSFHIKKKTYPKGFGEGLINLVRALPPEIRRFKIDFPLMPISKLTAVGQYARESDGEDLQLLFSAIFREQFELSKKVVGRYQSTENTDEGQFESQLDLLKSEIDADALAFKFGIPIDSARASFTLESVRLKESQNLTEIATSFYIHLLRHTQNIKGVVSVRNAEAEALALIERTFSTKGGFRGAIAEAKHATNGGLRMILDMLTEEYKHELKKQHVSYVLKSALDPLDWESKVSLITEIMKTLQHVLPKKIKSQPPERFAGHYELIVNAYMDSINKLDMIFRRL